MRISVRELTVFSMLGAIMFITKVIMELLPNIHLVGMLTMTYTLVYRKKALIPLYIFVLVNGLFAGFSSWWVPYLYIWTVLWGVTMLLPENMPVKKARIVYPVVCCFHGLAYGTLYAPVQALFWGMNFKATLAWIAAGLPFDAMHAAGNLVTGFLIIPLSGLLRRLNEKYSI